MAPLSSTLLSQPSSKTLLGDGRGEEKDLEIQVIYARAIADRIALPSIDIKSALHVLRPDEIIECLEFSLNSHYEALLKEIGTEHWKSYDTLMAIYRSSISRMQDLMRLHYILRNLDWRNGAFSPLIYILFCILRAQIFTYRFLEMLPELINIFFQSNYVLMGLIICREVIPCFPRNYHLLPKLAEHLMSLKDGVLQSECFHTQTTYLEVLALCGNTFPNLRELFHQNTKTLSTCHNIIENLRKALQCEGAEWIEHLSHVVMGFDPLMSLPKEEILYQRLFLSSPGTMSSILTCNRLPMLRLALCGVSEQCFNDLKLVAACYDALFHCTSSTEESLDLFNKSLGQAILLFAICSAKETMDMERFLPLLSKAVQTLSAESIVLFLESLSEEPFTRVRSEFLTRLREVFRQALGVNLSLVVRENITGCLFLISSRSLGCDGFWDRTDLEVLLGLSELLLPEDKAAVSMEFNLSLGSKQLKPIHQLLLPDLLRSSEPKIDSIASQKASCNTWLESFLTFADSTRFVTQKDFMAMALLFFCRDKIHSNDEISMDMTFLQFYLQELTKFLGWDINAGSVKTGDLDEQSTILWNNLGTTFQDFLRPFLTSRLSLNGWQLFPNVANCEDFYEFFSSLVSLLVPSDLLAFHAATVAMSSSMTEEDIKILILKDCYFKEGHPSMASYATLLYFAGKNKMCLQGRLGMDLQKIIVEPNDIQIWVDRLISAKLDLYAIRILDEKCQEAIDSCYSAPLKALLLKNGFTDEADALLSAKDLIKNQTLDDIIQNLSTWELEDYDWFQYDLKKCYDYIKNDSLEPIYDNFLRDKSLLKYLKIAKVFQLDISAAETLLFRLLRKTMRCEPSYIDKVIAWKDLIRSEWLMAYMNFVQVRDKADPDRALSLLHHCHSIIPEAYKPKITRDIIDLVCFKNAFSENEKHAVFDQAMTAVEIDPKVNFLHASYLLQSAEHGQSKVRKYGSLKSFAKCFLITDKYDDVACPRFLSLWFELSRDTNFELADKVNSVAGRVCRKTTASKFLGCASQILGELCQTSTQIASVLQHVILRLLASSPHAIIWKVLNFVQSKKSSRRASFAFLTNSVKALPEHGMIWQAYVEMANFLVAICDTQKDKNQPCLLSRLLTIPFPSYSQKHLVAFPTAKLIYHCGNGDLELSFINHIEDSFELLPSLQKPKKIIVHCNDGKGRILLCKPRDDMRKDLRFLEVASTILHHAKRKRLQMKMRTYAAVPLNEEAGIVEWVEGMISLRSILSKLYGNQGININFPSFRDLQKTPTARESFIELITTRFPRQLHFWFYQNSSRPQEWWNMRDSYVNSTAFMSVLGHIMGLGDRHCENILLCKDDGSIFHVDFSCLFERGKMLEVPELVPFRLTHNIVSAMGPSGWRGNFLTSSSKNLTTLKSFSGVILALLETLVVDPITDFETSRSGGSSNALEVIKKKLSGIENDSKFLNDRGHMRYLISVASDSSLLCQMYVGWAPFL